MTREESLFDAAADLSGAEREAFLDRECAGDADLRKRVGELLAAHLRAEAFFTASPVERPSIVPEEKAGDRIGRYKLLQKIGEGGCGTVYMAEQQEPVRRRVALKVIKLGMDTKAVIARFEAERQALALMEHPNIARVFDAGSTSTGRPFFVMELVCGVPITRYCDEENLSTPERLQLFIQVCHAIHHAHQKGIVHRDIKPSNILVTMVDDAPTPKIIDFGIAKATQGRLTDQTVFTAFEQFIGTPAYMSPEQAQLNDAVDARSDIYSLGVLLYELLTGRPPFDPKTLQQQGIDEIRRIIREVEPPRPSTRLDTLSEADRTVIAKARRTAPAQLSTVIRGDLDWIAMKAIEKKRARRYESAGALAADVKRHLGHEPVIARPPSTAYRLQKFSVRHRFALGAAAAVVVALGAGLGLSRVFERVSSSTANISSGPSRPTGIRTVAAGKDAFAAGFLSPDESNVAYLESRADGLGKDILVRNLRTGETRTITKRPPPESGKKPAYEYASFPVWSRDSKLIAYCWDVDDKETPTPVSLRIASVGGGEPRVVKAMEDEWFYPSDWSPDGKFIVGQHHPKVGPSVSALLDTTRGEIRSLGLLGRHERISPDGNFVVCERVVEGNRDVYAVAITQGKVTRITDSPAQDGTPIFSQDGRAVIFSSNRRGDNWDLWAVPFENGQATTAAFPVKYDFGDIAKTLTATGNLAFRIPNNVQEGGGAVDVYELAISGAGSPRLLAKTALGRNSAPAFSPDGKRVAFLRFDSAKTKPLLCVLSPADSSEQTYETGMERARGVLWSPDGRSVALLGTSETTPRDWGAYLFSLVTRERVTKRVADGFPIGFSSDGHELIVFPETDRRDRRQRIAISIATGARRTVTGAEGLDRIEADVTKDGARVVFIEDGKDDEQLIVVDMTTGTKRAVARYSKKGGYMMNMPRWSPDQTKIAYYGGQPRQVHVCAADGSWDRVIGTDERQIHTVIFAPSWSADSTKLVVALRENLGSEIGVLENFLPAGKFVMDSSTPKTKPAGGATRVVVSGAQDEVWGVLSPDESKIAYVDWSDSINIWVKALATGEVQKLTASDLRGGWDAPNSSPIWSPDSKWVACEWYSDKTRRTEVRAISVTDGTTRTLNATATPLDWSNDGKNLLCESGGYDGGRALALVSIETGQAREIFRHGWDAIHHARLSPDARFVAFARKVSGNDDIYAVEIGSDRVIRVTDAAASDVRPAWTRDGKTILFSSDRRGSWDLWAVPFAEGNSGSAPFLIKTDFAKRDYRVTRAGNLAFNDGYGEDDGYYVDVRATGTPHLGTPQRIAQSFLGQHTNPTWSPDGSRIAYIRNERLLCIQTVATGVVEVIDPGMHRINHLVWSPDGNWFALGPYGMKAFGLHAFNLQTRELKSLIWLKNDLRPGESDIKFAGFSPDGKEFQFRVYPSDQPRYRAVNVVDRTQRELRFDAAPDPIEYFDVSPDQKRIAYATRRHGSEVVELLVADLDFKNAVTIARLGVIPRFGTTAGRNDTGVWPRWSSDGKMIAYFRNADARELHVVAADGSWDEIVNTGQLKHMWGRRAPEWSPDGTKLGLTLVGTKHGEIGVLENFMPPEKLAAK